MTAWKLKRTAQCEKCPWIKGADPHEIPNGYSEDAHRSLKCTIAEPGAIRSTGRAMACHETHDAHCIGWLMNQLGVGNNIPLRMLMMSCKNSKFIRTRGEQHQRFEDTIPASVARQPETR